MMKTFDYKLKAYLYH